MVFRLEPGIGRTNPHLCRRSIATLFASLGSRIPTPTHHHHLHRRLKTTGGRKPKKRLYHREHDLDRAMDLQKKPTLILQLNSLIQSTKSKSILLRNLEKEVGFVQKWNLMAVIEKHPSIFHASGGSNGMPVSIRLTEKAARVADEEEAARALMEPVLVKNLRKLLMLTVDCRVPMEKIEGIRDELGLPGDYRDSVMGQYSEWFSVKEWKGREWLCLENWDSDLAVTKREEDMLMMMMRREGVVEGEGIVTKKAKKKVVISKDGNYEGPFAFQIRYPAGFRPNASFLEELQRWQRMEFPSPYLNARRFEAADPKARKRVVGVIHEFLSLMMHKRMTSAQLEAFRPELLLPARLLLCLIKHHGIFYVTNKGARSTVFLKEAYDGPNLIEKCPLLRFYDKFMALTGRRDADVSARIGSQMTV